MVQHATFIFCYVWITYICRSSVLAVNLLHDQRIINSPISVQLEYNKTGEELNNIDIQYKPYITDLNYNPELSNITSLIIPHELNATSNAFNLQINTSTGDSVDEVMHNDSLSIHQDQDFSQDTRKIEFQNHTVPSKIKKNSNDTGIYDSRGNLDQSEDFDNEQHEGNNQAFYILDSNYTQDLQIYQPNVSKNEYTTNQPSPILQNYTQVATPQNESLSVNDTQVILIIPNDTQTVPSLPQNDTQAVPSPTQNDTQAVLPQNDTQTAPSPIQNDTQAVLPQNDTQAVLPQNDTQTAPTPIQNGSLNMNESESIQITSRNSLPEDLDESGYNMSDGETLFLLITSFQSNSQNTGKLWVIPINNKDEGYVLVSGLNSPTGVCFDINHNFLYIVDSGNSTSGYIFQYKVDWDSDEDDFEISSDEYAVIYNGNQVFDCAVDDFGNLFFVVRDLNQINMVAFIDLWSGFRNQHVTIFEASPENEYISSPTSLDIYQGDDIYFLNSQNTTEAGTLVYAKPKSKEMNDGIIYALLKDNWKGLGLAVTSKYAYFTTADGTVIYN